MLNTLGISNARNPYNVIYQCEAQWTEIWFLKRF
ncbi:MAG: hypothetical protein ACI8RD_013335, partial [Bacillariaceae sp.]